MCLWEFSIAHTHSGQFETPTKRYLREKYHGNNNDGIDVPKLFFCCTTRFPHHCLAHLFTSRSMPWMKNVCRATSITLYHIDIISFLLLRPECENIEIMLFMKLEHTHSHPCSFDGFFPLRRVFSDDNNNNCWLPFVHSVSPITSHTYEIPQVMFMFVCALFHWSFLSKSFVFVVSVVGVFFSLLR